MSNDPVDLIALLVTLFALIASKEIAAILGPYAGIFLLACAGAAVSLSGTKETYTGSRAVWYVTWRAGVAVVVTVAIAELLQLVLPQLKPRYTVAPIAFLIGWIRDYNLVVAWFVERGRRKIESRTDGPQ